MALPQCSKAQLPDEPIDVTHYEFNLTLTDSNDEITGRTMISFTSRTDHLTTAEFDLDSKESPADRVGMVVTRVLSGDHQLAFSHRQNRLSITLNQPLQRDENIVLAVEYRGIPADGLIISRNRYHQRTFFGDNWPDRAHYWLPTIDHPSDKATSEFRVTAPSVYRVVSNGKRVTENDLPDGLRMTHWSSSVPLPTKVMVIGVAPFAVQNVDTVAGVALESWVYPQDQEPGFADFSRADSVVLFMTSHVGSFPYEKLANVQSTTRYGGMENAGAIFYAEDAISGTGANEDLIAHEIAHQWFGDSVTEADWVHVWLSEGFATYFAALFTEWRYGKSAFQREMQQARDLVFAFERHSTHTAVVDSTITDLNQLLNPITYQKGSWVLNMLRYEIGDSSFWKGIRSYYTRFRDGNATTRDFKAIMETSSGKDLSVFFKQWVYRPGHPVIQASWSCDTRIRQVHLELKHVQPGPEPYQLPVDVTLQFENGTKDQVLTVRITDRETRHTVNTEECPIKIVLDPDKKVLAEFTVTTERTN